MTLREQGYVGSLTLGLMQKKTATGQSQCYVDIPFLQIVAAKHKRIGSSAKIYLFLRKNKLSFYKDSKYSQVSSLLRPLPCTITY